MAFQINQAARWISGSTKRKPVVAVAGVTGAVGQEFLSLISERNFEFSELRPLASARSAGKKFNFQGKEYTIQELKEDSFKGCDITFFSAGGSVSKKYAPIAGKEKSNGLYGEKNIVIDNSSAFRMSKGIPLIIPEINSHHLKLLDKLESKIIANPNCSTIIMNMVVHPLHKKVGVKRVAVSTYQAASGAGAEAMRELETQAKQFAAGIPFSEMEKKIFGKQYIFNLFSHNSAMDVASGYNEEEMKMVYETNKIFSKFGDQEKADLTPSKYPAGEKYVKVTATCVRVPVLRAHCESINLTLEKPLTDEEARNILKTAPGVTVFDDRKNNQFPEPIMASGKDNCFVGRIRQDISQENNLGLDLFVAGDQIRKGAALNGIQIAELFTKGH